MGKSWMLIFPAALHDLSAPAESECCPRFRGSAVALRLCAAAPVSPAPDGPRSPQPATSLPACWPLSSDWFQPSSAPPPAASRGMSYRFLPGLAGHNSKKAKSECGEVLEKGRDCEIWYHHQMMPRRLQSGRHVNFFVKYLRSYCYHLLNTQWHNTT